MSRFVQWWRRYVGRRYEHTLRTLSVGANSNQEHTILILKKVILVEPRMDTSTETSLENINILARSHASK